MRISMFHTRLGEQVHLARHQEIALERAGVWSTLGYAFITQVEAEPTFSDAAIVGMLGDRAKVTRVAMSRPEHGSPDLPWHVCNPKCGETDADCPSFLSALDCASTKFGCDIVTVLRSDMRSEFFREADQRGVILLVV